LKIREQGALTVILYLRDETTRDHRGRGADAAAENKTGGRGGLTGTQ